MAKLPRDDDDLSPQESRAAALRAQGLSQAEAYRRAFNVKRIKPETVWNKASKLFSRSEVETRVRDLLKAARIQDIETVGETYVKMLDDMEAARTDGNHNAVMGFTRMKLQAQGALRDKLALTIEERASDSSLIEQLAAGDPEKVAALRVLLGASDSFEETRH